jgi:putative hydrolases of HD superfamily
MLNPALLERLYAPASIQRWNDHARPAELTELDKQAHKMIIAFVVAKFEQADGKDFDWRRLIEGAIFELLQRAVMTDIKPAVFREMIADKRSELNDWVLEQLGGDLEGVPADFRQRFTDYLVDPAYARAEKAILRAAHYLATSWEFRIIYAANSFMYDIEKTKEEIDNQVEDHYDLIGVRKILLGKKSFGFIDLCGQLRFQQRWARTPRVPKTTVLGHSAIVAIMAYLASLEIGACEARAVNNFFCGLFHDLPEVLTRDIISPIKRSVPGLDKIIKEYENRQLKEKILPLLPVAWHGEMRHYIENEFENRVRLSEAGEARTELGVSDERMRTDYNEARYQPIDGAMIDYCDKLAAFLEAYLSFQHGIKSKDLEEGFADGYAKYKTAQAGGIDFGRLFQIFYDRAAHQQ